MSKFNIRKTEDGNYIIGGLGLPGFACVHKDDLPGLGIAVNLALTELYYGNFPGCQAIDQKQEEAK